MTLKELLFHIDDNIWVNVFVRSDEHYVITCCGEAKHVKNSERLKNEIVDDWKIYFNQTNKCELEIKLK